MSCQKVSVNSSGFDYWSRMLFVNSSQLLIWRVEKNGSPKKSRNRKQLNQSQNRKFFESHRSSWFLFPGGQRDYEHIEVLQPVRNFGGPINFYFLNVTKHFCTWPFSYNLFSFCWYLCITYGKPTPKKNEPISNSKISDVISRKS